MLEVLWEFHLKFSIDFRPFQYFYISAEPEITTIKGKNMYGINMSFHFISFGGTAPHSSIRRLLSLGKVEVPVLVLSKSA